MTAALPTHAAEQTLLYLLLDDLPATRLVSGYAGQRADAIPLVKREPGALGDVAMRNADLCAGWAVGATILNVFGESGEVPTPIGPHTPSRFARR